MSKKFIFLLIVTAVLASSCSSSEKHSIQVQETDSWTGKDSHLWSIPERGTR